ncbi:MAG: rod shape-determining protein MreC, partial [Terriglobales bacterium]
SIFPKGLPIGTVTKVSPGSDLFLNIRVRPAADLSRLEEVLVVTQVDTREPEPDKTNNVRAVDILAERLPSVPPKPETVSAGGDKSASAANNSVKPASAVVSTGSPASQTAKPTATQPASTAKSKSCEPVPVWAAQAIPRSRVLDPP